MRVSTGQIFYNTPEEKGSTPLLGPLRYDKATEDYYFTIPALSTLEFTPP